MILLGIDPLGKFATIWRNVIVIGVENLTKIAEVNPYRYENSLIIALSGDWIDAFGKIPKFFVFIEDGELILKSEQCSTLRRENK